MRKMRDNAWQIFAKQKTVPGKFEVEKFLTGGKLYYSFKEAQADKKDLQKMSSSFEYKVIRVD